MRNAAAVALSLSRDWTLRYWPHTPKQHKIKGKVAGLQPQATAVKKSHVTGGHGQSTHCLINSRFRSRPRHKYVNFT